MSDPEARRFAAQPEMDPLTEEDALREAQLLEVRIDALRSSVSLLLELRMAIDLRTANTGILIAYGVRELTWSPDPRMTDETAWNIVGSVPRCEDGLFRLALDFMPNAGLEIVTTSAAFFAGDVPGLDETPPDYGDDDAKVRVELAGWKSEFLPIHAVFLDPAPSPPDPEPKPVTQSLPRPSSPLSRLGRWRADDQPR
jgi:hypothetical protein